MPTKRDNPYGAFNFLVALGGGVDEASIDGGFSDASGLDVEVSYAEYRNGNELVNAVRKIQNTFKVGDVTLKRGLIGTDTLFGWLRAVREGNLDARTVTITLLDEARNSVATWTLRNAQPKKWTGPTLAAKGGTETAMEELVLTCEQIDLQ